MLCHLMERWPSGRRRSPAKGVWGETSIVGSNPTLSDLYITRARSSVGLEYLATNQGVGGSIPSGRTISCRKKHYNSAH